MTTSRPEVTHSTKAKDGYFNPRIEHSYWGPVFSQTDYAPGIAFVSTASHGGFVLGDERAEWLEDICPGMAPFTRDYHYWEEDSDAAVIMAAFPHLFTLDEVKTAAEQIEAEAKHCANRPDRLAIIRAGQSGDDAPTVEADEKYPLSDWQYEVGNGDTKLGYAEWWAHRVEANAPPTPTNAQMIMAAWAKYGDKGRIEVDGGAKISRGSENTDHGAYVSVWVWVTDEEGAAQ